jgi:DNA/RNA-binding domain of Phe-tRNA-synthetase-like protein
MGPEAGERKAMSAAAPELPEIAIAEELRGAGIALRLGLVAAALGPAPDGADLADVLTGAAQAAVQRLGDGAPSGEPAIAAARRAYKALGKDPARYRPAAEALLRRARQGKGVAPIHPAVDVNNVVSLETGLSIGSHDLDRLRPPLLCRAGREGEAYRGIGRGAVNLARLPLLADADGPCGCPTSDSERAAVGPATRHVLMVLYGFGGGDGLDDALARAEALLRRNAGARAVARTTLAG